MKRVLHFPSSKVGQTVNHQICSSKSFENFFSISYDEFFSAGVYLIVICVLLKVADFLAQSSSFKQQT